MRSTTIEKMMSLSKFTQQLEQHQIHETLNQVRGWLGDEPGENHGRKQQIEWHRISKIIQLISETLQNIDPEVLPVDQINSLNIQLRSPGIWEQLSAFSSDKSTEHLSTVNQNLDGVISILYQIGAFGTHPSHEIKNQYKTAYSTFCQELDAKKQEFFDFEDEHRKSLVDLEKKQQGLSISIKSLQSKVNTKLPELHKKYKESEQQRTEKFLESQKSRTENFGTALASYREQTDVELNTLSEKYNRTLNDIHEKFEVEAQKKTKDIEEMHHTIRRLFGSVTNDAVGLRYKKGADAERWIGLGWSVLTVFFYSATFVWVILKGNLGFGLSNGPGIDWPVVTTTLAVTGVSFAAARFSGKQASVHRINEQRMRWFSFEVDAIGAFIQELERTEQQTIRMQLTEKLFGQDRVVEDQPTKSKAVDLKSLTTAIRDLKELLKSLGNSS